MSINAKQQEILDGIYEKFQEHVDAKEYADARNMLAEVIGQGHTVLAKTMNEYYNENVCQDCLGTGRIVEGEFDNQIEKECICQSK